MMTDVLATVLRQLNEYLAQLDGMAGAANQALVGNVSQLDKQEVATELDNHVVLTLVNIEEERTLKNGKTFLNTSAEEGVYRNRPVNLNLFLLFTANYRNYETALKRLAQVLSFFQGKQRFTAANSPAAGLAPPITDFTLAMDLMSLTFEQVNHLWGFLGAKQSPSVLYRGRLVTLDDQRVLEGGGRIRDIEILGRGTAA